jgi:hypothetical protein
MEQTRMRGGSAVVSLIIDSQGSYGNVVAVLLLAGNASSGMRILYQVSSFLLLFFQVLIFSIGTRGGVVG